MREGISPKVRGLHLDDKYGKFSIEPLERGFGHTLGNSLRRVVLAYIGGAAVTDVRIKGVLHEFSTLPGIVENSTEILLSIKEIAIRIEDSADDDDDLVMKIRAKGRGEVLGADIEAPAGVEIVNPELHIAELTTDEAELEVDMWVSRGVGFVQADDRERGKRGVDVVPTDAVFSPIHRANYRVEPTRLGSRTDLDRLIIELWGDGTVRPDQALRMAAREILSYMRVLLETDDELPSEEDELPDEQPVAVKQHDIPIEDVDFSVRTFNCLKKESIDTLGHLVQRTEKELLAIRNFGKRSLAEVLQRLDNYSLQLADAGDEDE
jgi:DNA-directed RNA polymerase subunit alpha